MSKECDHVTCDADATMEHVVDGEIKVYCGTHSDTLPERHPGVVVTVGPITDQTSVEEWTE